MANIKTPPNGPFSRSHTLLWSKLYNQAMIPVNCLEQCSSDCCRDVKLEGLTKKQADNFHQIDPSVPIFVRHNQGQYTVDLAGRECPFLDGKLCQLYSLPELRPRVCYRVTVGGWSCLSARIKFGREVTAQDRQAAKFDELA